MTRETDSGRRGNGSAAFLFFETPELLKKQPSKHQPVPSVPLPQTSSFLETAFHLANRIGRDAEQARDLLGWHIQFLQQQEAEFGGTAFREFQMKRPSKNLNFCPKSLKKG